jgi:hypothetical protein
MDFSTIPDKYHQIVKDQLIIGWNHIAKSWAQFQQQHYSGLKPVKGQDGTFWTCSIISHVFTQWIVLWEARDKSVHGEDSSAQAKSKHYQAMRELEILYSFKDQVLHRNRQLFFDNIAAHKEKPTLSI